MAAQSSGISAASWYAVWVSFFLVVPCQGGPPRIWVLTWLKALIAYRRWRRCAGLHFASLDVSIWNLWTVIYLFRAQPMATFVQNVTMVSRLTLLKVPTNSLRG